MGASAVLTGTAESDASADVQRLLVAWQHPESRLISAVGFLQHSRGRYTFGYLRRAARVAGFRPFTGFDDLATTYTADRLFSLFSQRVMNPKRPDYPEYLRTLGLPKDVGPMEILGRSGGRRAGDTIQLFPEPDVTPEGATSCLFLVHGVRHQEGAGARIAALRPGDRLELRDEPTNAVNPRALLVAVRDERPLGWVPDFLVDYVHEVRRTGDMVLRVEHSNGEDVPPHMRLLVSLAGFLPPGRQPFRGDEWETFT